MSARGVISVTAIFRTDLRKQWNILDKESTLRIEILPLASRLRSRSVLNPEQQACWTISVVRTASAKFGLQVDDVKFNTQDEEW